MSQIGGREGENRAAKAGPVRVLHILGTLERGGAESRVMDLYRAMDKEAVQFDFLVHTRGEDAYSAEVRALGGHIYTLPRFRGSNAIAYRQAIRAFFRAHREFSILEAHMTSTAAWVLPLAKAAYRAQGEPAPVTIAHARSAGTTPGAKGLATRFLRRHLPERADLLWTCSEAAGRAVYGDAACDAGRVETIPNAIATERFVFDAAVRAQARRDFCLPTDAFVVGHVGRFDPVKNQTFLWQLFRQWEEEDAHLVFVGDGPDRAALEEAVRASTLQKRVHFTGALPGEEVARLYQAMDVFCLPSHYEGLPGTVVEAQAAGLFCLVADTVTKEVCITEAVERIPLAEPERWRMRLSALAKERQEDDARLRRSSTQRLALAEAGYDAGRLAETLRGRYLTLAAGGEKHAES